jgi:Flp pilus assembly protein TadD
LELNVLSSEQTASLAALEQKAVDLARRGEFGSEARAVNQELTQLAPDNPGAWTRFARCCLELGELDAANAALESALTLNPQNNIARSLLQEVVRRELLATMPPDPPVRARKSRSKKTAEAE